jgi:hypothetical protein
MTFKVRSIKEKNETYTVYGVRTNQANDPYFLFYDRYYDEMRWVWKLAYEYVPLEYEGITGIEERLEKLKNKIKDEL